MKQQFMMAKKKALEVIRSQKSFNRSEGKILLEDCANQDKYD